MRKTNKTVDVEINGRKVARKMKPYISKNELSRLVLDNGIKLEGKKIKGVRSYSVKQKKDESTAELTLFMDLRVIKEK